MIITDEIVDRAQEAWEDASARWRIERSSVGGIAYAAPQISDVLTNAPIGEEAALHRFETWDQTVAFKRDKIIRAILAVLP